MMLGWSLLSKQWMHRHQKNLDGLYLDFVTRLIQSIKSKFKGTHLKQLNVIVEQTIEHFYRNILDIESIFRFRCDLTSSIR